MKIFYCTVFKKLFLFSLVKPGFGKPAFHVLCDLKRVRPFRSPTRRPLLLPLPCCFLSETELASRPGLCLGQDSFPLCAGACVSPQGTSCSTITLVAYGGRAPKGAGRQTTEAQKLNQQGYSRPHLLQPSSARAATPSLNQHGTNATTRGRGAGARSSPPLG